MSRRDVINLVWRKMGSFSYERASPRPPGPFFENFPEKLSNWRADQNHWTGRRLHYVASRNLLCQLAWTESKILRLTADKDFNPYNDFHNHIKNSTFSAVPRPCVWSFPQSRHFSQLAQSIIEVTFLNRIRNSFFKFSALSSWNNSDSSNCMGNSSVFFKKPCTALILGWLCAS